MKKLIYLIISIVFLYFVSPAQTLFPVSFDTASIILPTGGAALPAHAIGDNVGQSLTAASCPLLKFSYASRNKLGAGGILVYGKVTVDSATSGTVRLTIVRDTAGMTYVADNAAYAPTYAMGKNVIGTMDLTFSTQGTSGSSRAIAEGSFFIPYTVKTDQYHIYARVSCVTAVTFKYGGNVLVELGYVRN